MPPNKPQTALSLEAFRSNIGWNPYFFYQLANGNMPVTDSADLIVCEYPWQRPMAASRSDKRRAIAVAEQKLSTALNYDVSTRYRSEGYAVGYLKQVRPSAYASWGGYGQGYGQGYGGALLQLNVGKLQRIATVSYTSLSDFAVTITDEDGDGLDDTFTGTIADSTVTDTATVIAAFSASDQPTNSSTASSSNPLDWQIRPVTVTRLNASTLQITGPSWLLVKPALYERAGPSAGYNSAQTGISSSGTFDPNKTTNFVAGLTAWVKTYTLENQATLVRRWGTVVDTSATVTATIVDADQGLVQVDLSGGCLSYGPSWCGPGGATEEIRINYEAGATDSFRQSQYLNYQTDWDTVVARFAIAELSQVPAATAKQNPQLAYWREDLAHVGQVVGSGGDSYRVGNEILNNPFRNTRRGAVEAWQAVSMLAQQRAVNL
jgi:hypothetical protein